MAPGGFYFGVLVLLLVHEGHSSPCMGAVQCNLIKGDVARVSSEFGNDSTPYYKMAEKFAQKIQGYKKGDGSVEGECTKELNLCKLTIRKMGRKGLKLEFATLTCSFETWSLMIFFCENIKLWPQNITDLLSPHYKECLETKMCETERFEKYHLDKGTKLPEMWNAEKNRPEARAKDSTENENEPVFVDDAGTASTASPATATTPSSGVPTVNAKKESELKELEMSLIRLQNYKAKLEIFKLEKELNLKHSEFTEDLL